MLKKALIIGALAVWVPAHADAAQWRFTWTGFNFENAQESYFDPDFTVAGTFSGIDTDGDGAISLAEVTELTIGSRDYANVNCSAGLDVCSLPHFYYSAAEGLSLVAQHDGYTYTELGGLIHVSHYAIDTSLAISHDDMLGGDGSYSYYFTPQTVTTITAAVPEPQAYAMFGAGMLLLAGAARRRLS